jgi:hypothetical protein
MPRYSFHIENGFAEDHALELANDSAAIDEGLRLHRGCCATSTSCASARKVNRSKYA